MMTGKEKLYFLLEVIGDVRAITPSGKDLAISLVHDLNKRLSAIELSLLFEKLEKDEKVLKVLQSPNRVKNAILEMEGKYREMDDGRYHIELLPTFDQFFSKVQLEPEYQEFTGKKSTSSSGDKVKVIDEVVLAKANGKSFGEFTNDLKRLQDQYQTIKDYPEREFFLGLADYVKLIVETPGIDAVADLIEQQRKDDEKELARLESLVREDIGKVEKALLELISSKKIDFPLLKLSLENYLGVRDGRIQSSAQQEEALWENLAGVVRVLKENGHGELIKKYIVTNAEGNIVGYSISPRYGDYLEELRRYRDLRERTVWGSWNDLILVYLTVHKFDEELKKLDPQKDVWRRMNFIGLWGEMQKIVNEQPGGRIEFERDSYKLHLDRVQKFAVEKLFPMYPVIQSVMERVAEYKFDSTFLQAPALYLGNLKDAIGTVQSFSNSITSAIGSMQNAVGAIKTSGHFFENIVGTASNLGSLPSVSLPVQGLGDFSEPEWRGEVLSRLGSIEEQLNQKIADSLPLMMGDVEPKIAVGTQENIIVGKLRYSFKSCELSYDNGLGVDAPLDNKEMKFFISLYGRMGEVVDYKDLCRDANTSWYRTLMKNGVTHEELKNSDFASDAYILRRDFRSLIVQAGMPEGQFSKFIRTVSKKGYKLVE